MIRMLDNSTMELSSIILEKMSFDEFIAYEQANGAIIHDYGGIWWRQVRPGFIRPVFPFITLDKESVRLPTKYLFGGFQFHIDNHENANSSLNYYIYENPADYCISMMSKNNRKRVNKACKFLRVYPISDMQEIILHGHKVYVSFYHRTHYKYMHNRTRLNEFKKWAGTLISNRKILVLGAYYDDELVGLSTLALVEDIVVLISKFTHPDYFHYYPSDILLHENRKIAAAQINIRYIYSGMQVKKEGINTFKEQRGATLIKAPAYCYLNPVIKSMLTIFSPNVINRMFGRI
jgi:hypothetical protein